MSGRCGGHWEKRGWALAVSARRAGSFRPPRDLDVLKQPKPKPRERPAPHAAVCEGFIWKRPDFSGLARIGFPTRSSCTGPALRRTRVVPFILLVAAGSVSKQKRNWGAHSCLPPERLPWPQHGSAPHQSAWLAPPPPLPHAPPRPPPLPPPVSGGSQPLQGALASKHGGPRGGLLRVQGQPVCRCAGGWGGPARDEEVGPVGSVSPVILPAWTFALRKGVGRNRRERRVRG